MLARRPFGGSLVTWQQQPQQQQQHKSTVDLTAIAEKTTVSSANLYNINAVN